MKFIRILGDKRGIATFIALMIMVMLTMIGLAALKLANDEIDIAGNELNEMASFYSAEAGLESASAAMQSSYETTGAPPVTLPVGNITFNDCNVAYKTVDNGAAVHRELTSGSLAGLNALVKTYTIKSMSTSQVDASEIELTQEFECAQIPLFQFAVFYTEMLQTSPAYGMTIDGRVHVNSDMWLNGWNGLTFTDKVTCAGKIRHGLENGAESGAPANVYFRDEDNNSINWKQGGQWLDADASNWYDSSSARWDGWVSDEAYGQEELNLPLSNSGDPHKIIERGSGNSDSYEHKATLKIMDGVPYAKMGTVWQDISGMLPAGTITAAGTTADFTDGHEEKTIKNTQVDLGLLQSSGYYPSNGVIYVSDQRSATSTTMNGVTLANGTDLGAPLTLASENPVYVEGDYNTVDKQPASIIADACTFLSNDWASTNKAKSHLNYNYRPVSTSTTANVSIVTGDLNPSSSNYGGGLENLPRFLEHWGGKTFQYRGSMICLWKSQIANGTYKYKGSPGYYSAPTRDWGFDHDLEDPSKLPPETPVVRAFQRVRWQQSDISYRENYSN